MEENKYLFDEDKAVEFIRRELPENISIKFSDDEILTVIDIIWDYYEKKGLLSLNIEETEEEQLDPDDLTVYVKKTIKENEELFMDPKDIDLIVKAELDYEESLEDYV